MKSYNLKVGLLKYNLIFYISEDYNEEYFTSLEEKRYFFKERIEESIQYLFDTKVYIKNIVINDEYVLINIDSGDYIRVTKITPIELEYMTYIGSSINKFSFLDV